MMTKTTFQKTSAPTLARWNCEETNEQPHVNQSPMRQCKGCNEHKPIEAFAHAKSGRNGRQGKCKACMNAAYKAWLVANADKKRAYLKSWRAANPARIKQYQKKADYSKRKAATVAWRKRNPERVRECRRKRRERNRAKDLARVATWIKANRDKVNAWRCKQLATNPSFKIASRIRERIARVLKKQGNLKTSSKTRALLGCTSEFLRSYIEARFKRGMSWENYGEWHLDHRIPCASFDLTDPAQQRACFHYTNLQPLWKKANLRKGKRLPQPHQAEFI